ncbi:peptidoglycan DD-metalloendopeptidase family protein [Arcanobacterium haemolyticum]|nr:peptidoglycan DD-metalloendopeptidase family protein [Arcanobacterium haemolyticum]
MTTKKISAFLAATALLASGLIAAGAYADDRSDLVEKQKSQQGQLESTQSALEGVDTDLQSIYLALETTRTQIPVAQAELDSANAELAEAERGQQTVADQLSQAEAELSGIEDDIANGNEALEETRGNLGAIARSHYRGENVPSTLDLLMGSSSSEEFLNSYAAAAALTRTQTATLQQVTQATAQNLTRQARQADVKAQIEELKKQADELVAQKESKQSEAQAKTQELANLQSTYESQSAELESKKADFEASISSLQSDIDATKNAIAEIDAQNAAAAAAAAARGGSSSGGGSSNAGAHWLIPVVPAPLYVTSPFGMREYPFGGYWMHNGVDLRSACGEAQVAPANGTIAKVIPAPGNSTHGNQIYINLGNVDGASWVAVTNHLSGFNVRVGQTVSQGDVIGWTGQTGQVTGCHVHMEVWKNGRVVDPMSFPAFTRRN